MILLLKITMSWSIFSVTALAKKATLKSYLDFLPSYFSSPFPNTSILGSTLKNDQLQSYSKFVKPIKQTLLYKKMKFSIKNFQWKTSFFVQNLSV